MKKYWLEKINGCWTLCWSTDNGKQSGKRVASSSEIYLWLNSVGVEQK